MKKLLSLIAVGLVSCLAFPNKRPLYITTNGKKQLKLVIKYSDNGECTYWLKGIEGSRVRGGLRIIDTTGRYSSGDTLMLTLPR
jgi:hypothetical protein